MYFWILLQTKEVWLAYFNKFGCKLQRRCYKQQHFLQYYQKKGKSYFSGSVLNYVTIIAGHYMWNFFCILYLVIEILSYFIFFMFLSTEKFLGTLRKENRKSMVMSVAILALFVLGYLLICSWTLLIQNKNPVHI